MNVKKSLSRSGAPLLLLIILATQYRTCLADMLYWGYSKSSTHLKVGVVVIRVFGLSDLHGHPRLLHELTSSERQTGQHALAAALQHPLQNLTVNNEIIITITFQAIMNQTFTLPSATAIQTPLHCPHYLLPQRPLLQLHQHDQDVSHVRGATQLQGLLVQRRLLRPVGQQQGQDVACVKRGDGLVDLHQVLTDCPVAADVQFLVEQGWAFGAPLLGVAELQVALWIGDELLGHYIDFFCCLFTVTGFRLWEWGGW